MTDQDQVRNTKDRQDFTDPDATSLDHRGMRVLDLEECLTRLRDAPLGRVAFSHDGETVVLPVNHYLDGVDVVFRTSWGAKLQHAADAGRVAFEIDWYDVQSRSGGSVLVQGSAVLVDDRHEARRLEHAAPAPWLPASEAFWVRVRAAEVSGREILRQDDPR